MANALYLLALLALLTAGQSAADEACDSVECLPGADPVCALHQETGSLALFADECVLRCTSCRTTTTEFKKVNASLCSPGTKYISACPDIPLDYGNEETQKVEPDDGIMVVGIDVGEGDSVGFGKVPPLFRESLPLPLPLLSMGSEILRRLVMSSQPEPPPPQPEGITLIKADVKVDVTINMPPPPAAARLALPPPLAMPGRLMFGPPPPPPPPPQSLQHADWEEPVAYSAAPRGARPTAAAPAAAASLVALIAAARHI